MASSQNKRLAEFAYLQMAAEAFLSSASEPDVRRLIQEDILTFLRRGNRHASAFTPSEAQDFLSRFEILAQYRNDPQENIGTGFSGTLFKNRSNGELTLSFRSTEFIDDAVRDGKATNETEIKELGWAVGQIAAMEAWYKELKADSSLIGANSFNVTGYSLGGHLATAFNILRREEAANGTPNPVLETVTFNGAGTGGLGAGVRLGSIVDDFTRLRGMADVRTSADWLALSGSRRPVITTLATERAGKVRKEWERVQSLAGIEPESRAALGPQADYQYQLAVLLATSGKTIPASNFPLAGGTNDVPTSLVTITPADLVFRTMTEVVGSDSGNLGPSFVSNSGIHWGKRQEIYIEDQPLVRGSFPVRFIAGLNFLVDNPGDNNFSDTHSLVLIVDSLALMAALESIDPAFTPEVAKGIYGAASAAAKSSRTFTQGKAEGDTLETVLDALRALFLGPAVEPVRTTLSGGRSVLDGNTWFEPALRTDFHVKLAELNQKVLALRAGDAGVGISGASFRVQSLFGVGAAALASSAALSNDIGLAYRYALTNLTPFVVSGNSALYGQHNLRGELERFDASARTGTWTTEALADRAAMLALKLDINTRNANAAAAVDGRSWRYSDMGLGQTVYRTGGGVFADASTAEASFQGALRANVGHVVAFGSSRADALTGGPSTDRLYDGAANDYLDGRGGDDYSWTGPRCSIRKSSRTAVNLARCALRTRSRAWLSALPLNRTWCISFQISSSVHLIRPDDAQPLALLTPGTLSAETGGARPPSRGTALSFTG